MGLADLLKGSCGSSLRRGLIARTYYAAPGGEGASSSQTLRGTASTASMGMSHLPRGRGTTAATSGNSYTMPTIAGVARSPALTKPITPKELTRHLAALLTRHGSRGDWIVAEVHRRLVARYRHPNPIGTAIEAVKPVIKYYKSKSSKAYIPLALYPRTAEAMAMRWLIQSARAKTYVGDRPDIVRGLVDEIEAILQGTSTLFRKRFDTHRNPN